MSDNRFHLMHGDSFVCDLGLDGFGHVVEISSIVGHLMPWGTIGSDTIDTIRRFNEWWSYRCIPSKRHGIEESIKALGHPTREALMISSLAVNMSDHYWICPEHDDMTWSDVSFHRNGFDESMGLFLYGSDEVPENLLSPDCSTDGVVPKMWVKGDRLIKGGTLEHQQEPFNEVIASELMHRLGIDHVEYRLEPSESPSCSCPCICDDELEMIPARCMMYLSSLDGKTIFQLFEEVTSMIGLEGVHDFVDRMLVVDHLMANSDRHYNNFTILRDPSSLEALGFAPIFDTGSSLGFNQSDDALSSFNVLSRTFKQSLDRQLYLIDSFDWLDVSRLDTMDEFIRGVFEGYDEYVSSERVEGIIALFNRRLDSLVEFMESPYSFTDLKEEDIIH